MFRTASLTALAVSAALLAGCGAAHSNSVKPTHLNNKLAAKGGSDADTLAHLHETKISFIDGIKQSEAAYGFVTQAKFEMKDGHLALSVYNCPKGRETHAEFNPLTETIGDATVAPWAPKNAVFEDVPHLVRSAMNLTVMQSTKLSLIDLIKAAEYTKGGTAWYAIPQIYNGRTVLDIKLADGKGGSTTVHLDPATAARVE
jgi:hypothetical protein